MARILTAAQEAALGGWDDITGGISPAAHARTHVRLEVLDTDGVTWNDLTYLYHGHGLRTSVDDTVISGSIQLSRSHTDTALTISPLISDAIGAGRRVRFYETTVLPSVTPIPADLDLIFDGVMDIVDAGGDLVEMVVRDRIGAQLADLDTIDIQRFFRGLGPRTGGAYDVADIIENILASTLLLNGRLVADIPIDLTLSGALIGAGASLPLTPVLEIDPQKLLEAVRDAADRIGWQLRPRWNETDGEFQLAFYEPPSTKTTVDWYLPQNRYIAMPSVREDITDIRNAIRVSYVPSGNAWATATVYSAGTHVQHGSGTYRATSAHTSSASTEPGVGATWATVWVVAGRVQWPTSGLPTPSLQDAASIARFGFRFMELVYDEHDAVRTAAQAQEVAEIALADLAWPLVDLEVQVMHNWAIDIDDRITLQANNVHFSTDQTLAVVAYEHTMLPTTERTRLRLRGKPVGGVERWHLIERASATPFTAPAISAVPSQTGNVGTLTLTIVDPHRVVSAVDYSRKTGTGDFDAYSSSGWDTSAGTIGADTTLVRARNVTLLASDHMVAIRWRVTYVSPDGETLTIGGSHSFDAELVANITGIEVTFTTSGVINVAAVGDEDTTNMYITASAGGTPSDPTNASFHASIAGRSGAASTGITCPQDTTATVKVRGYNSAGAPGPVLTVAVVRPNVTSIARASTTETIRSTTAPTTRVGGTSLIQGDIWIDTDDGNKPYIWDGSVWVAAYTSIDGGSIKTGAIRSIIYTPGSAGWSIDTNGTVEFNSGTFRGAIHATAFNLTFSGSTVGSAAISSTGFTLRYATGTQAFIDFDGSGGVGAEAILISAIGGVSVGGSGRPVGFFGALGTGKPTITGSKGGNAALASLMGALAAMNFCTDSTT